MNCKFLFVFVLLFSFVAEMDAQRKGRNKSKARQAEKIETKEQDGKYGVFRGEEAIFDYQFDTITYKYGEFYGVRINQKWGLVDTSGSVLIDCKYDWFKFNPGDGFIVSKAGLTGVVSSTDSVMVDFIYDNIDYYRDSTALVKLDGQWGMIKNGQMSYDPEDLIFHSPEQMPLYERCIPDPTNEWEKTETLCAQNRMLRFIYKNLKYPAKARDKGIAGMVVIGFVIDSHGMVVDAEILKDIGGGCGDEALRVVKLMKKPWIPGRQDDKNVSTQIKMPIKYRLW